MAKRLGPRWAGEEVSEKQLTSEYLAYEFLTREISSRFSVSKYADVKGSYDFHISKKTDQAIEESTAGDVLKVEIKSSSSPHACNFDAAKSASVRDSFGSCVSHSHVIIFCRNTNNLEGAKEMSADAYVKELAKLPTASLKYDVFPVNLFSPSEKEKKFLKRDAVRTLETFAENDIRCHDREMYLDFLEAALTAVSSRKRPLSDKHKKLIDGLRKKGYKIASSEESKE